jgi:hypothetical protein
MVPLFRRRMRRSAAIVPHTEPRWVTSVARRNSSGDVSATVAYTAAMALLTQTSIGPSFFHRFLGGFLDRVGVGYVEGEDERAAAGRLYFTR